MPPLERADQLHQLLADIVLFAHAGFVLFVVAGLPVILIGGHRRWRWVRNPWFRLAHLASIGIVVAQAWAGVICPLTSLEMWLRSRAGYAVYQGSFVQHWLQRLIYYDAPPWVFVTLYTVFALLVLASWALVPPRFSRKVRCE